jgi:uncharacterized membrane protein YuzA (DUF378 family)
MIRKEKLLSLLYDIRFWILIFFIIRLVGITNPPLEIGHSWRQSLTCMISRNFVEENSNIFYPQIDYSGNKSGVIGSEFPLFNYLIYLVSLLFGYSHWFGRLINLIVSSAGIYCFFLLVKNICNKKTAFSASIILLSSIWFAFSRKIMPDTFSVSLVIIGLYFCYKYLISGKLLNIILFFIFTTFGILCKIPALSLLSVIIVLVFVKEIKPKRKLVVFAVSAISFAVVSVWYFLWVPHLLDLFHNQLYFPKGFSEGIKEILPLLTDFFEKFYFSSLYSYIAFVFFLAGLFFIFVSKNSYLKSGIVIITLTFFCFIIKTGAVFPTHNYYIIPFTPVMALIAGFAINKFPAKYFYIPLLFISIEGIANQQHDFFIKKSNHYIITLEDLTDKYIGKNELIVINGGQGPRDIYFSHRKGWTVSNDKITMVNLNQYKIMGANYLIIDKNSYNEKVEVYPIIYDEKDYSIYSLK